MPDPTFVTVEHGTEGWDAPLNDNFNKVRDNFMRRTKSADHGQETYVDHATVESGVLAGAMVTLAGLIPAGCILLGVTHRVTAVITGATTWDSGDGVTQDLFANDKALALGTTAGLADHKAGTFAPKLYTAAGDVVFTANGPVFTAGKIRATAHFIKLTPPTS